MEFGFGSRVGAALAFLAITSGVECAIRGRRATRWRSSLVLVACGTFGAAVGVAVDLLTSTVGPAYFAIGKGLGDAPGLTARALALGAQAGTGAGVVLGAVLILCARRPLGAAEVAGACARIGFAVLVGLAIGAGIGCALPERFVTEAGFDVAGGERRGFLFAWSAHVGVYAGALVGAVVTARRVRVRSASVGLSVA